MEDEIDKVERQVVAGMNYRLTVSLRYSCTIPGGAKEVIVRCEEIRVFMPLPVYCKNTGPNNPKCMDLLETVDDKCSRDIPPSPGGSNKTRAMNTNSSVEDSANSTMSNEENNGSMENATMDADRSVEEHDNSTSSNEENIGSSETILEMDAARSAEDYENSTSSCRLNSTGTCNFPYTIYGKEYNGCIESWDGDSWCPPHAVRGRPIMAVAWRKCSDSCASKSE